MVYTACSMGSMPVRVLTIALAMAAGCAMDEGVVELNWVFVDRAGERMFPKSALSARDSMCDLAGRRGAEPVRYDLHASLLICDLACVEAQGGCAEACVVLPRRRLACDAARHSEVDVPASSNPYVFDVDPVLRASDRAQDCLPAHTCVSSPGPRQRRVRAGKTVDLQVMEYMINVLASANNEQDERLDLDACGC